MYSSNLTREKQLHVWKLDSKKKYRNKMKNMFSCQNICLVLCPKTYIINIHFTYLSNKKYRLLLHFICGKNCSVFSHSITVVSYWLGCLGVCLYPKNVKKCCCNTWTEGSLWAVEVKKIAYKFLEVLTILKFIITININILKSR